MKEMVYLNCDYMSGAHPAVLQKLNETNFLHTPGYGDDDFTRAAAGIILNVCGIDGGSVFFTVGGTQTNLVVIDRLLNRNDAVIAADSAHISVHEAGAIELSGHKVIELNSADGKLSAGDIDRVAEDFYSDATNQHMVRPSLVYISFPTELGTIYSRDELGEIYSVCRKRNMLLYVDGARLAYGLAATGNNLSIRDLASLCDVFYIGGTKCGALFGEAIVSHRPELFDRFFPLMKMHGAILAKGRLLGVQFRTLFEDGLYFRIGEQAVRLAEKIKKGFIARGYELFIDSPTNQQFIVMNNTAIEKLREIASFDLWGPEGEKESVARFVTDWSTREEDVEKMLLSIPHNEMCCCDCCKQ